MALCIASSGTPLSARPQWRGQGQCAFRGVIEIERPKGIHAGAIEQVVVFVGFAISRVVGGRIDEDLRRERKVIITREQCCSSTQVAARAEL